MKNNNLWRWIKDQIIQEVPIEIATCEFDCRRENCLMKEWENCPRRIKHVAVVIKNENDSEKNKKPA